MNHLRPVTGFHLELPEASLLIAIKGYALTKGIVPTTYGDIMNDVPLSKEITLQSLSFYDVFEELMTKSKFFLKDKRLSNKHLFFLKKCGLHNTYHWINVRAWSEKTYTTSENPNENFFIEPWRNTTDRKHLLENSIFFVLHSRKKLSLN